MSVAPPKTPGALAPIRRLGRRGAPAASVPFPVKGRIPGRDDDVQARTALLVVTLLTLLGAALRLAVDRGIWLDEAISIHQARLPAAELVQNLADGDRHPPLHALVLHVVVGLFGTGDLTLRAPSLVAGTLLVPVTYALGRELHDRRTGLLAAGFTAIAPVLVWYSQEVRGYALVALFGTLTVLFALRALRTGAWRDWLGLAAAAALATASHWFALLVVGAVALLVLGTLLDRARRGTRVRQDLARAAAAAALLAVELVPLGLLAAAQVHATGTQGGFAGADGGGDGVSFYTVVANASWALWGFHPTGVTELLSAGWPLFILAALLLIGRGAGRPTLALLWCVLVPVVALGLLALRNPQLFEIRYAIAVVPSTMVLLARVVLGPARSRGARVAGTALVTATLVVALVDQQRNPGNPRRYDYREALSAVRADLGPRDVLLYEPSELRYVLDYYAPRLTARPLDGARPSRREAPQVVVLASFLDQARYRGVVNRELGALRYARRQVGHETYAGVDVWRFR